MWIHSGILCSLVVVVFGRDTARHSYREINECPDSLEIHVYPHPKNCNQFYKCENGTLSVETCQNGLLFDGHGAIHNHCNYYWAVNCGDRVYELVPEQTPFCEYSFGIFKAEEGCSSYFYRCSHGVAEQVPCKSGLAYDEKAHSCNWPDRLLDSGCNPEALVGFRCPDLESIPANSLTRHFLPFPRFAVPGNCQQYVTCVNNYPRLMTCEEDLVFNDATLTCDEPQNVHQCSKYYKN